VMPSGGAVVPPSVVTYMTLPLSPGPAPQQALEGPVITGSNRGARSVGDLSGSRSEGFPAHRRRPAGSCGHCGHEHDDRARLTGVAEQRFQKILDRYTPRRGCGDPRSFPRSRATPAFTHLSLAETVNSGGTGRNLGASTLVSRIIHAIRRDGPARPSAPGAARAQARTCADRPAPGRGMADHQEGYGAPGDPLSSKILSGGQRDGPATARDGRQARSGRQARERGNHGASR
jgi:hypothetical protein